MYQATEIPIISRDVIADSTFFGKRFDKSGVLVFKDAITSKVLAWHYIQIETM